MILNHLFVPSACLNHFFASSVCSAPIVKNPSWYMFSFVFPPILQLISSFTRAVLHTRLDIPIHMATSLLPIHTARYTYTYGSFLYTRLDIPIHMATSLLPIHMARYTYTYGHIPPSYTYGSTYLYIWPPPSFLYTWINDKKHFRYRCINGHICIHTWAYIFTSLAIPCTTRV